MIEKIYEISCDNCSHTITKKSVDISIHIDNSIVQ